MRAVPSVWKASSSDILVVGSFSHLAVGVHVTSSERPPLVTPAQPAPLDCNHPLSHTSIFIRAPAGTATDSIYIFMIDGFSSSVPRRVPGTLNRCSVPSELRIEGMKLMKGGHLFSNVYNVSQEPSTMAAQSRYLRNTS